MGKPQELLGATQPHPWPDLGSICYLTVIQTINNLIRLNQFVLKPPRRDDYKPTLTLSHIPQEIAAARDADPNAAN